MRLLTVLLITLAGVLAAAPAASAVTSSFVRYPLSANAVGVVGLPGSKAYPRAHVIVPSSWKVTQRSAGRITLLTDKRVCPYVVTLSVRMAVGPSGTATEHVTAALPAAQPAYVMDSGVRRSYAWRVVRQPSTRRLDAMQAVASTGTWSGLPAGQSVWSELRASAPVSSKAGECHSGHYREVARQIGDAIVVNTRLS